jgi:dihydroorotase
MSLVHGGQLTLADLVSRLTCGPAGIIGNRYGKLGTLAVGEMADVTLFDPDMNWVVDTGDFASRGKNTPLAGAVLKGKVMATIAQGKLVYKDDSIMMKGIGLQYD